MPPDALAEKPERDEADLRSAARSAAGALKEAIDAFVEVRVVTAIGAQALSEDLVRCWYEMRDLQPPAANPPAADAFKDVISAQQDKERMVNEARGYANDVVPRARGQAAQILNEADAYRNSRLQEASGSAQRFIALSDEYAKARDVTRTRLYLETMETILPGMNKVLIDDMAGKQMVPYLPLDQFLPRAKSPEPPAGGSR